MEYKYIGILNQYAVVKSWIDQKGRKSSCLFSSLLSLCPQQEVDSLVLMIIRWHEGGSPLQLSCLAKLLYVGGETRVWSGQSRVTKQNNRFFKYIVLTSDST